MDYGLASNCSLTHSGLGQIINSFSQEGRVSGNQVAVQSHLCPRSPSRGQRLLGTRPPSISKAPFLLWQCPSVLRVYFQFLEEIALKTSAFWSKRMFSNISSPGPCATSLSGKESKVQVSLKEPLPRAFWCLESGFFPAFPFPTATLSPSLT